MSFLGYEGRTAARRVQQAAEAGFLVGHGPGRRRTAGPAFDVEPSEATHRKERARLLAARKAKQEKARRQVRMSKAANGEGSVYQRKDGRWVRPLWTRRPAGSGRLTSRRGRRLERCCGGWPRARTRAGWCSTPVRRNRTRVRRRWLSAWLSAELERPRNEAPRPVRGLRCAPGGIRTPNRPGRNRLLYPLSYGRRRPVCPGPAHHCAVRQSTADSAARSVHRPIRRPGNRAPAGGMVRQSVLPAGRSPP